ncbi:MAG TPA: AsnC family transcriptional regulator [Phycisphaerae bacterium]|nr:AsnC family transcriptional regulator [Phycisphaerae bacterium]
MTAPGDEFDRRLLSEMQRGVPLVRRPFAQLADALGVDEAMVLARVEALRRAGRIREISGVFDCPALGYGQTLAAMETPPDALDRAGRIVAEHPGVSHCYSREGDLNLWYTLAVSPASRLGLDATAELLARCCGAKRQLLLPTLRRYKLRVRFGDEGDDEPSESPPARACEPVSLNDEQRRIVRALQADLPATSDAFAAPAAQAGLDADMLLVHAADFLAAGWMRRYAAVLHHRAAGAAENLLAAWRVDPAAADAAGAAAAQVRTVSHCYLRPGAADWPYSLYTMIHGASRDDCLTAVRQIETLTGLQRPALLWTGREYAKRRVRLFGDEERAWERAHGGAGR